MNDFIRKPVDDFDGFVNYFTKKRVNISEYFIAEGENTPRWGSASTVLDYSITGSINEQWASSVINPVITFSFKYPILLTHYRLRTRTDRADNMPISWIVECSYDNSTWYLIDTKTKRTELIAMGGNATFACDNSFIYARFLRFNCTETTGWLHFHLSRVEFFGKMDISNASLPFSVPKDYVCSNNCKSLLQRYPILFVS